ncbi:response regulator [Chitinophaga agrisoli]|uniref:Response regulator n=1 Tax=Chitinophaga agrisoli TaxID=2607653 RepID=A0A5B2VPV5_9BACT|nr:response regulator [Chitinophaga agrisoli]KAA2240119.1 response regulator [Chitinophaga agrisoli]
MESKLVFVVDDDEIFHFIVKKLFAQNDHYQNNLTITSFFSAEDALEQIHPDQPLPAVIIVDINMQPMNGWEFIAAYRKLLPLLPQPIPIVMCSSSMDERDIQQVQVTPELCAYITKPLDKNKLKEIEKYL